MAESVGGTVVRQYMTDEAGTVVKVIVPAGQPDAGTYLVNWNGHGDALNLVRLNTDGTTTLANSYHYGTWGAATTTTHNGIADLNFRFLYGGKDGVQADALGLYLMGARHYSPELGRFLQPDPAALEENPYSYGANNPVSKSDPDGTFWYWVYRGDTLWSLGRKYLGSAKAGSTRIIGTNQLMGGDPIRMNGWLYPGMCIWIPGRGTSNCITKAEKAKRAYRLEQQYRLSMRPKVAVCQIKRIGKMGSKFGSAGRKLFNAWKYKNFDPSVFEDLMKAGDQIFGQTC